MADTDIEVLLMEMKMMPSNRDSVSHVLSEIEKVAQPVDIALIERIRKANSDTSTIADVLSIMDGIGDLAERPPQCYTKILMECIEIIVNQTEVTPEDDVELNEEDMEAMGKEWERLMF